MSLNMSNHPSGESPKEKPRMPTVADWRRIDKGDPGTYPELHARVLVCASLIVDVAEFGGPDAWWEFGDDSIKVGGFHEPTHWAPLPGRPDE